MNRDKSSTKYVGMDVHRECVAIAVLNREGRQVSESIVPTAGEAILEFIQGLRGTVWVTLEETTQSAWLYDLLQPYVSKVVVCNPRKNALLKVGNKNDKLDARKLAELLRGGQLSPVYHGQESARTLKELGRAYTVLTEDTTRVMARLKAIYRGQALSTPGKGLYSRRRRQEWLQLLQEKSGLRQRAEFLFEQLDSLRAIRRQARQKLVEESRKFQAAGAVMQHPFSGAYSRRPVNRKGADALPFPRQAAVLELLRLRPGDTQQRRLPGGQWSDPAQQEAGADHRVELPSQSPAEEHLQGSGHHSQRSSRATP